MSRRFFKNAGLLAATEIILKLKGLVLIPMLTSYFGALNYGAWAQVGVLVGTFSPLIVLGTDSAVLRYLPGRSLNEQKRFFSAWLILLLTISTGVCLSLYLWKHKLALLFFGASGEYELFIPLVALSLFVGLLLSAMRNWFIIHNNATMIAGISISQSLLGLLSVIIVMINKKSVYELVIYSLLADSVIVMGLLIQITRIYGWSPPDYSIVPALLKYGLPLFPAAYAMWGLNSMDRLFLIKYASLTEVGVYGLVYGLGYIIIQIIVNPVWMMFPGLAAELYGKNDLSGLKKLFERSVGVILALAVPAIVGLFVLGERLVSLLATSEFLAGAPLMAIVTTGYLLLMLTSYYDTALGLAHRQYWSTISILFAAGINFVLNIFLIPKYVLFGAAVATVLAFLFQFLFSYTMANRLARFYSANWVFPLKIIFASSLMGLGLYELMLRLPSQGFVSLIILITSGVTLYGILLLLFRVITPSQVKSVLALYGRSSWRE